MINVNPKGGPWFVLDLSWNLTGIRGQVTDVTNGGFHHILRPEILTYLSSLGGRFHNNQSFTHHSFLRLILKLEIQH